MDRRNFMKAAAAGAAVTVMPRGFAATGESRPWRTFEVTTRVELVQAQGLCRAWLPLPLAQPTDYFKMLGNEWKGNMAQATVLTEARYGSGLLAVEWKDGEAAPVVELVSRFQTRNRKVDLNVAGMVPQEDPAQLKLYLAPTEYIPTDGIVRDTAQRIVREAKARTDLEKARAIYDWVVENTVRDPKTRGCGVGDVKYMLEANALSGKCADLNAIFVGLARAVGIPARDVYGIRVANSDRGYKSLGKAGDITKAQHCRAEFYLAGHGWVPVDPADVRKVILEEKPGLTLNDDIVKEARSMLFGGWEMNWLAYNYAHDLSLPGSAGAKVPFLMYPQAESAQGRHDSLDPDNFKYRISSREITT